ncbi:MAG TPA: tyrosine-type recombinase/integrase [Terriglobia bacterium]|nr:tyrosine-type recombinase/integrase [Terriglobia bacterium]
MKRAQPTLDQLLAAPIQNLATTLQPQTVKQYRACVRSFLAYLHARFPHLRKLSQLRRDPHLLGWFRFLCQHHPPLCNLVREARLVQLRRILRDLADQGHPLPPDLIRRQDFPPRDQYLPRPLPLEEDQRLQQQLRLTDSLESNALRLMRATGIRIGECIALPIDCLHSVNEKQVALHVPLGKLHSERLVPVDEETQGIVARLVELRSLSPALGRGRVPTPVPESPAFLLPRYRPKYWAKILCHCLAQTARAAGCTGRVTPHRLRHSFATEMVRLGVSLPALMQMLGHKDIRMTMRYVEVVQLDLQREFRRARQNPLVLHSIPQLPLPASTTPERADLATVRQAIAATRHLLQLFQPQLEAKVQRKLRRLTQRLLNIDHELDRLSKNECTLAG